MLDVLSVYLLQHLSENRHAEPHVLQGWDLLRKVFARTPSRLSRDVDFVDASYQLSNEGLTADKCYSKFLELFDGRTIHDIHWKVKSLN